MNKWLKVGLEIWTGIVVLGSVAKMANSVWRTA